MPPPDRRPAFPNPALPEIPWPTEVTPEDIVKIRVEQGPIAIRSARVLIKGGKELLASSIPPFAISEELIRMSPADGRKVLLIDKYTYPAREFLSIIGQGIEDDYPFNLIREARMTELFADAVAPSVRRLFDSALWTQQFLGPLTPLWTNWLEPALLHPLKTLWVRAQGLDRVVEKQAQELEAKLLAAISRSNTHTDYIKSLIENGFILEAIDSITRHAILNEKNPIPSHIMTFDAGRQRFHQLYQAAQAAGLG